MCAAGTRHEVGILQCLTKINMVSHTGEGLTKDALQ